ncbi:MAG: heparinase, partial [Candidatus Neomarinimicrobiota bacterium]
MRRALTILAMLVTIVVHSQEHPNLILTAKGVKYIQANLGKTPLFDKSVEIARAQVDAEIKAGIDVPIPKDLAGGYTHERHKANFFTMQKAGVLFQITGDEKYATYIQDMLLEYAEMYPILGKHPAERSYARGK